MQYAVITLWVLNLFDALATWYSVHVHRYAYEGNPSMAVLIERGPWAFFGVKLGLVTACCVGFWFALRQQHKLAKVAVGIGCVLYGLLALWHVYGFVFWRHS